MSKIIKTPSPTTFSTEHSLHFTEQSRTETEIHAEKHIKKKKKVSNSAIGYYYYYYYCRGSGKKRVFYDSAQN